MGITKERIKRITEQAAAMKAIGRASVDVSNELDALVSDNALMEAKIQGLEEANARLRERLNRGENHDACMKLPLDADGVPIRIGDEIVDVFDEHVFVVDGYCKFPTSGKMGFTVEGGRGIYEPSVYQHKKAEPADSWEKLEEDARKTSCDYASAPLDANGLTTCDGCRFEKCGPCHIEKALDVVKRAKKLAGIEKLEGEER